VSPPSLLPRARLLDVVVGRAPLIGARCASDLPRGFVSPVEPRIRLGMARGAEAADEAAYLRARTWTRDLSVLARTAAAWLLSPSEDAVPARRPFIVSAPVDDVTIEEVLDRVFAPPAGPRARMVHLIHAEALNLAVDDGVLASQLQRADLVLADGLGIRLGASVLGYALRHDVSAFDLLRPLADRAAREGVPLALVGGMPGVAAEAAERLKADHAGLRVELTAAGFLTEEGARAVVDRVRALGRCVVLVGMGSPRQERWAHAYLGEAAQATVLTVGGLLEVVAQRVPRAPDAWRELGLEWTWRLQAEPRRLAARYLVGGPRFATRVVRQRLRSGRGRDPRAA
jgi:N-acetylglucosaminyldiphosphoundecaprenol N-acetyl-beta-D-mannosaminyltransferase